MYIPLIKTLRLDNGLLTIWSPRTEVNSVYLNAKVLLGSADLPNAALPHALEHLVEFSPTKEFPSQENIQNFAVKHGIDSAAKTSYFFSEYTGSSPVANFKNLLLFFKERLFYSLMEEGVFEKELLRIKEESNERTSDPLKNFLDNLLKKPYGKLNGLERPIGNLSEINNLDLSEIKEGYAKYYTPDNSILLASGPAELEQDILQEVQKTFGSIPTLERAGSVAKNRGFSKEKPLEGIATAGLDQHYFAFVFPLSTPSASDELRVKFALEMLYLQDSLLQDIRDKFGLYLMEAQYEWLPDGIIFYLYGTTENIQTRIAVEKFVKEKFSTPELITAERFAQIKQKQIDMLLLDFEIDTKTLDLIGMNYLHRKTILTPRELLKQVEDLEFSETKEWMAKNLTSKNINTYIEAPNL